MRAQNQSMPCLHTKIVSLLLSLALALAFVPITAQRAYAEEGVFEVSREKGVAIALDNDTESGFVYYINANDEVSYATITDLAESFSMISNWKGDVYVMANKAPLDDDHKITLEALQADDSIELTEEALSLDYSNAYGFWAFDADYNTYRYIVNLPNAVAPSQSDPTEVTATPIDFSASVNGVSLTNIETTEGGYVYCDWTNTKHKANLYTVTIPEGTTEVTLSFDQPCLAYNYKFNEVLGYQIDDNYLAGAVSDPTAGSREITVSVDTNADGAIDAIQVQDPYNADYTVGDLRIAVTFKYASGAGQGPATDTPSASAQELYSSLTAYLQNWIANPENQGFGGFTPWVELALLRSGTTQELEAAYNSVVTMLQENSGKLDVGWTQGNYTEYSRTILQLTAMGYDPTDVAGYNLLEPLADFDQTVRQGVNGAMYALLALDSHNYTIPQAPEGKTATTRDALIKHIVEAQVADEENGGYWCWSPVWGPDVDMTAIGIQALAPYYGINAAATAAIDDALKYLASVVNENAGFGCSESDAQVVIALCALGINPDTDSRFVKNGTSVLDDLCSYGSSNGFGHDSASNLSMLSTQQGYMALVAYDRFMNGKTALYDMNDVAELYGEDAPHKAVAVADTEPTLTTTGTQGATECRLCGEALNEGATVGEFVSVENMISGTAANEVSVSGELVVCQEYGLNPELIIDVLAEDSSDAVKLLEAALNKDKVFALYSITLSNNGEEIHSGFGKLTITFAVGEELNGKTVRVRHLHQEGQFAGKVTCEDVVVENGKVTIEVSDLSSFMLEELVLEDGNPTVPGQSGSNMPTTGDKVPYVLGVLALIALLSVAGVIALRKKPQD